MSRLNLQHLSLALWNMRKDSRTSILVTAPHLQSLSFQDTDLNMFDSAIRFTNLESLSFTRYCNARWIYTDLLTSCKTTLKRLNIECPETFSFYVKEAAEIVGPTLIDLRLARFTSRYATHREAWPTLCDSVAKFTVLHQLTLENITFGEQPISLPPSIRDLTFRNCTGVDMGTLGPIIRALPRLSQLDTDEIQLLPSTKRWKMEIVQDVQSLLQGRGIRLLSARSYVCSAAESMPC